MPGIGAEAPVAGLMVLKWGRTEGASSFGSIPVATCKGMTDRDRAKPFCRVRTLSPLNRMQFSLRILPPSRKAPDLGDHLKRVLFLACAKIPMRHRATAALKVSAAPGAQPIQSNPTSIVGAWLNLRTRRISWLSRASTKLWC
jgi:hypothetical protein